MMQQIFLTLFGAFCSPWLSELSQPNFVNVKFGDEIGQELELPRNVLDFRYVASFRNEGDSNTIEVENRHQISYFFTSL